MDMATASSLKEFSMRPGRRPVKVVNPSGANYLKSSGQIAGYITCEKYLFGKTCKEIERLLGLRPFDLRSLAYVFVLQRLPTPAEIDFHLSTAFPGGGVYDDKSHDTYMEARENYRRGRNLFVRSHTPVVNAWPPGSARVPQWKIRSETPIPAGRIIAAVTPVTPFARPNGSIQEYHPHNRGPIR